MRSFWPLPRILNSSLSRLMSSILSLASSLTRRPVEKNNSKIALSRSPARSVPLDLSGASRIRRRSWPSRNSTWRSCCLASSIFSAARLWMSFLARYLRKPRKAMR